MTTPSDFAVERSWLCERIVDRAGEAVLFADPDGIIQLWNDAAEEIFGFSREEAIGSRLDLIIPDEYINAHWHGYERALERGETTNPLVTRSRVPACRANGDRIEIETSGARVVTDDQGEVVGVLNLIRDVSDTDT